MCHLTTIRVCVVGFSIIIVFYITDVVIRKNIITIFLVLAAGLFFFFLKNGFVQTLPIGTNLIQV